VDARLLEGADLVVHQCDQGTDDDGDALAGPVTDDRRYLVAQALAAAGGHEHERIAAADGVLDDRLLQATERAVAEDLVEDAAGGRVGPGGRRNERGFGGLHRGGDRSRAARGRGTGRRGSPGEGHPARGCPAGSRDG
jgi:hypothetical protein